MEDFVYVVVLLLISAIPAIQKGIQKKSKPKKKRMSASGNITNVITSDSAISLTFSPEQPEQTDAVWEDFDLRKAVVYSEILRPKF